MGCRNSLLRGEDPVREEIQNGDASPASCASRASRTSARSLRTSWVNAFRGGSVPFKTILAQRIDSKIVKAKESQVLEKLGIAKGIVLQKIITDRNVHDDYAV